MIPVRRFARVVQAAENRVELAFAVDPERFGFFCLPPQHPCLLEKYQYHGTVAALEVMTLVEPGVRTALTHFEWQCPPLDPAAGYGTRAICEGAQSQSGLGFTFDLDTVDGQRVVACRGSGVVFANRDFGAWRAQAKVKAKAAHAAQGGWRPEVLATPAAVCARAGAPAYVTPFDEAEQAAFADVPAATSFMPDHPFHTGSGDHVNAGQLFDCALQVAHLALKADAPRACRSGHARLARYVELDIPFRLTLTERTRTAAGEDALTFTVSQLGRENGLLGFTLA